MKQPNRWFLVVLTGLLLSGSLMGPLGRLHAAPAAKEAGQVALVNVNRADASELESIRGIGPMLAERIIKHREANGRFEHLEDLTKVPGIGQAKFEKIKSQITL